ncbi:MAG: hypothetical protein H6999_10950 [Hahellaceae bacterium]|nr:hypothetical protein [Hahellaceae bacterium]
MAQRLKEQGETVEMLALIDSAPRFNRSLATEAERDLFLLNLMSLDIGMSGAQLAEFFQERSSTEHSLQALFKEAQKRGLIPQLMSFQTLYHSFNVMKRLLNVVLNYQVGCYDGSVMLFKAELPLLEYQGMNASLDWDNHVARIDQVQTLSGNHFTLLHGSNVQTLASYLRKALRAKVSTRNRLFQEILPPFDPFATHVIEEVRLDALVKEAKARLCIDEQHPFFFDHPLDHIPGALMISGLWELLTDVTEPTDPDNPALCRYVQSLHVSFQRWAEKDVPTPLSLLLMDGGPQHLSVSGIVTQNAAIVAELDACVGYQPKDPAKQAMAGQASTETSNHAPDFVRLLHKQREENVVIAQPTLAPAGSASVPRYQTRLAYPHAEHYLSQKTSTGVIHPMHLLEAARQMLTWLGHAHYGVPEGHPMNLISVEFQQSRPLYVGEPLTLEHEVLSGDQVRIKDIVQFRIELHDPLQPCGHILITAQAVDRELYERQRQQ